MKLWLLSTKDGGYDTYDAFVVRAATEADARALLIKEHGGSKYFSPWPVNQAVVTCEELTSEGEPGEILGSFNAG